MYIHVQTKVYISLNVRTGVNYSDLTATSLGYGDFSRFVLTGKPCPFMSLIQVSDIL